MNVPPHVQRTKLL